MREPFVISRQVITQVSSLHVTLSDMATGVVGKGAAVGLDYAGETPETMMAQIEAARSAIETSLDRNALCSLLPMGGARAAVDAALWDLEAKSSGRSAFSIAGVTAAPVLSTITIGMGSPGDTQAAAAKNAGASLLKLKVGREHVLETVEAARRGAPKARFLVDPNQAWSIEDLNAFAPALSELGIDLLEQPTPVGDEASLDGYAGPIPLCADESCDGPEDLPKLKGRFAAINIKLDKVGGLTAALALADAAETAGFALMVGSMVGPSSTVAPAMVLAQRCRWADVDAPPFLIDDDEPPFEFDLGVVEKPYLPALWG